MDSMERVLELAEDLKKSEARNKAPVAPGTIDLTQAKRYCDTLIGGDSSNERFTSQTIDDDRTRKDPRLTVLLHGTLGELAERLEDLNRRGAGVYITVNKTRAVGRRTSENVIDVRAIFIDLDGAAIDPVKAWTLQPHIIVESSPGKYHAYWRAHGVKLEEFGMLQRKLATLFNGDPSVCDLPRILRLPGFWHQKKGRGGLACKPFMTRIIEARPQSASYSRDALMTALKGVGERRSTSEGSNGGSRRRRPREQLTAEEYLNQTALDRIMDWAPEAFPSGAGHSTGAWRVRADDWGKGCEEDLSIAPNGIRDFGQEWGNRAGYTPVSLLQAFFKSVSLAGELEPAEFDENARPMGTLSHDDACRWLAARLKLDWDALCAEDTQNAFAASKPSIAAERYVWRDPKGIEPRAWLYDHHFIRKYLSATIAPGGLGKSSLLITEALAMVTGLNLLGEKPAEPLRVWYWNGEDPREEIERRIAAGCDHYGIAPEQLGDRLFVNSGRDTEIVVAREARNEIVIAAPVMAALRQTIRDNRIDLVIVDPFVASHAVSENDNGKINAVCRQWAMLADETGCAVELVHHVRKGAHGQGEFVTDDARGAGAMMAAVRSARVLNVMTKDESSKAGVTGPRAFFRVDKGKANLAPPSETSSWRRIISVPLGNGSGPNDGDYVGVVTAWDWPDPADDVMPDDICAIHQALAEGEWRENAQASNWVGKLVAQKLDLDLDEPSAKAKVKALIKAWVDAEILKLVVRPDARRKPRTFVEAGKKVPQRTVATPYGQCTRQNYSC